MDSRFRGNDRLGATMDISIIATIGFTTAAVLGIIALIFTAGKEKQTTKPDKRL